MKKFECNECYKGPCYFEMQKGVTGKPAGCLLFKSKMPAIKDLPEEMQKRITSKTPKPYWVKL